MCCPTLTWLREITENNKCRIEENGATASKGKPYYFTVWKALESVQQYLMNSPINLHWNNEVCIADGLQEDKKTEKRFKTIVFFLLETAQSHGLLRNHMPIFLV